MLLPRKAIQRLKKYRPPQEGRRGKLRLDFNENTVGCAPEVVRALCRAIDPEMLSSYPEYHDARVRLARWFGVKPEETVLANGTDDAIQTLVNTFVDPRDALLVPAPTFPVYEFFHNVAGGRVVRVRYDEHFRWPVEEVVRTLRKRRIRWVAIANPNNPTGTTVPKAHLRRILEAAPETLVLVDEAYYEFSGETVLPWIRRFPNLVVSRTFSKAFGLAALRMGLLFANAKVAEAIQRGQNPFAVNSLALAAALEAIRHTSRVKRLVAEVLRNREVLSRFLASLGLPYVPSKSNFVLTRVGARAPEIARRLRAEGILVRDWSYDPRLTGCLRFTVGSTAQTRRLIRSLRRYSDLMERRAGEGAVRELLAQPQTGWFA
jgi:histidinol-phosphate aminotransferase